MVNALKLNISADDYLALVKNGLINDSDKKYNFTKDIYTEKIHGVEFRVLEYEYNINNTSVKIYGKTYAATPDKFSDKTYAAIQKDYLFSITKVYTSLSNTTNLDQLFSSIIFYK